MTQQRDVSPSLSLAAPTNTAYHPLSPISTTNAPGLMPLSANSIMELSNINQLPPIALPTSTTITTTNILSTSIPITNSTTIIDNKINNANAYMLFCAEHTNPSEPVKSTPQLFEQWNQLSNANKIPYQHQAIIVNAKLEEENDDVTMDDEQQDIENNISKTIHHLKNHSPPRQLVSLEAIRSAELEEKEEAKRGGQPFTEYSSFLSMKHIHEQQQSDTTRSATSSTSPPNFSIHNDNSPTLTRSSTPSPSPTSSTSLNYLVLPSTTTMNNVSINSTSVAPMSTTISSSSTSSSSTALAPTAITTLIPNRNDSLQKPYDINHEDVIHPNHHFLDNNHYHHHHHQYNNNNSNNNNANNNSVTHDTMSQSTSMSTCVSTKNTHLTMTAQLGGIDEVDALTTFNNNNNNNIYNQKLINYNHPSTSSSSTNHSIVTNNNNTIMIQQPIQERLKRPPNAYLLFNRAMRRQLLADDPKLTVAEISKKIGDQWKYLPQEQRQFYINQAQMLKQDHLKNYPDFIYTRRSKAELALAKQLSRTGRKSAAATTAAASTYIPGSSMHHHQQNSYLHSQGGFSLNNNNNNRLLARHSMIETTRNDIDNIDIELTLAKNNRSYSLTSHCTTSSTSGELLQQQQKGLKRKRGRQRSKVQRDPRGRKKKRIKHPTAPKHPMSGFLFFLGAVRPEVAQQFPGSTVGPISKEISSRWKNMTAEERQPWLQKAIDDKARYAKEMQVYMKTVKSQKENSPEHEDGGDEPVEGNDHHEVDEEDVDDEDDNNNNDNEDNYEEEGDNNNDDEKNNKTIKNNKLKQMDKNGNNNIGYQHYQQQRLIISNKSIIHSNNHQLYNHHQNGLENNINEIISDEENYDDYDLDDDDDPTIATVVQMVNNTNNNNIHHHHHHHTPAFPSYSSSNIHYTSVDHSTNPSSTTTTTTSLPSTSMSTYSLSFT